MRRTVVDCLFSVVEHHEAIDETGSERVAAADTVVDFKAGTLDGVMELALVPAECAPVVDGSGLHAAKRRGDSLEVGILLDRSLDHAAEAFNRKSGEVLIHALDLDSESRRKVLLVADHYIHILCDLAVDLLGLGLSADGLPERSAIVEIVGRNCAVLLCRLESLDCNFSGRGGESREDAARVEPAHAFLSEELFPVDHAGLELGDCGKAAVRAGTSSTASIAALDEVESVADVMADAVELSPVHVRSIDATLKHEILNETPDRIVGERRDSRGLQTEAATKTAHDVVFAAAFPHLELACTVDATIARIKTKHDLSKARGIPHARTSRLYIQTFHFVYLSCLFNRLQ